MKQTKERIKHICAQANPGYTFHHEQTDYMNLKADRVARGDKFAFLEALRTGEYITFNRRLCKVMQINLYFCKFHDLDLETSGDEAMNSAEYYETRETLISEIEAEIVTPLIKKLNDRFRQYIVGTVSFGYPNASLFDANEISVRVSFRWAEPVC